MLVGTEAVLHRVRRAGAVAFLDFDQHLLAPRFAAAEEALALLARAGRLVGGRGQAAPGAVLVQTRLPDHEVLAAAVGGDPGRLATRAALRRARRCPPFAALAVALGAERPPSTRAPLAPGADRLEVDDLGDGRWLVRAPDHAALCDALAAVPRPQAGCGSRSIRPTSEDASSDVAPMATCSPSASTATPC